MNEFNLSDKINYYNAGDALHRESQTIEIEDVKEFIRLLKEGIIRFTQYDQTPLGEKAQIEDIYDFINKLAGDKLK